MFRESMLWPSISIEAALRARRFLRAYSPIVIEKSTKTRLVKTSQERDCMRAKTLVTVPTMVARAERDSREDCKPALIRVGLLQTPQWMRGLSLTATPASTTIQGILMLHLGLRSGSERAALTQSRILCI